MQDTQVSLDLKMTPAVLDEWVLDFVKFGGLDVPCDFETAWLAWRSRGLPATTKGKFRSSLWRLHDEGHIWLDEKAWVYSVSVKAGGSVALRDAAYRRRREALSQHDRDKETLKQRSQGSAGRVRHTYKRGLAIYPASPAWRDRECQETP